jgi:hypothetical protein
MARRNGLCGVRDSAQPANFDLDRLLHRGRYRINNREAAIETDRKRSFWEEVGIDRDFTARTMSGSAVTLLRPIAGRASLPR